MRLPISVLNRLDATGTSRAAAVVALVRGHEEGPPDASPVEGSPSCPHTTVKVLPYMTVCADCKERLR